MLRLAFDFIIAWREIRARPNAYWSGDVSIAHVCRADALKIIVL